MYRNISYIQSADKKTGFIDLWTWDENGERIYRRIPHKCFVSYEVPFKTNLRSIFGTYLKRKFFESTHTRYQWIKDNKDKTIFEASTPEFEFLASNYSKIYQNDDFAKHDLRIHYLDIEIAIEDEFPNTIDTAYPINLITVFDSDDKKYHTWALDECVTDRDDVILNTFTSEIDLLHNYIEWHKLNTPDVITTWNGKAFDIPYICNRVKMVLGKDSMLELSPVGRVKSRKDRATEEPTFTIDGITDWDYYQLYKNKFKEKSQGSYSLGNVGEFVLGIGKIDYDGTMKDLYKKDFQKFFEYNIRDVEILVGLEENKQLLKLARTVCNIALSPYDKIYSSIPYIINSLYLYAYEKTERIFPKYVNSKKDSVHFEGAYVFPTKSGFYTDGVAIIDLNSLYPNTLIAGNMSPETKVGTFNKISDDEYVVHLTNGKNKLLNKVQFDKLLETKCINTDDNTLFFKHELKSGIVPTFCQQMYIDRKQYQKKMNSVIRQLSKTKEEHNPDLAVIKQLEFDRDQFNSIQYTLKIFMNSIYGMFGTEYSPIYDIDIAQSITKNGQFVIRSIPAYVEKHMKEKYGAGDDIILFGDTDSIGINYESATKQYCSEHNKTIQDLTRTDIKNICNELDDFVNNNINPYCTKIVNERYHTTKGDCIAFSREKFCREAMFFSKKHYILHIEDLDGHKVDKFDYKGVDIAKNELSPEVKQFLKVIFERICRERWDQNKFTDELSIIWNKYKTYEFEQVKKNTGWNTDKRSTGFLKVEKGTGAHVKSAIFYNQLIEHLEIKSKYNEIKLGDDVQWCYINPQNKYGIEMIGYKDVYPVEFKKLFQIDYALKYEKDILKPLTPLMGIMNWIPFNPNNQSMENIFDL